MLGTGKFPSLELMRDALEASGTEIVTVALRREYLSPMEQLERCHSKHYSQLLKLEAMDSATA